MTNPILESVLNNIDEEISDLRRDKEDFIKDINDIDNEITTLLEEKVKIMLNNLEETYRDNDLNNDQVTDIVNAVYNDVRYSIATGVAIIVTENRDADESSSDEHVHYATLERTKWLTKQIINRLETALNNIVE